MSRITLTRSSGMCFHADPDEVEDWLGIFGKHNIGGPVTENINRLKNSRGEVCAQRAVSASQFGLRGI